MEATTLIRAAGSGPLSAAADMPSGKYPCWRRWPTAQRREGRSTRSRQDEADDTEDAQSGGDADLARLANLLPVQLELGIPADLAPLALAGAGLTREHYLTLIGAGLRTPEEIGAADDETVLKCIGHSRQRLRALQEAVQQTAEAATIPALDEALPPPTA
jgi:hypothetical protein